MQAKSGKVLVAIVLVACGIGAYLVRPRLADAQVVHGLGFEATVAGWTSWYGSYELAGVGSVWCIDHGLHAPDAAFGYRPTAPPAISPESRTAMAWILGRHGSSPDPVDAAAIMLALHDLNGAIYPQGPLRVDQLGPGQFAGFAGAEAAFRDRAVRFVAEGRAHASLQGSISLSLEASDTVRPGAPFDVTARLQDTAGRAVAGESVTIHLLGATPGVANVVIGADGSAHFRTTATRSSVHVTADIVVPALDLTVFGPAGAPAQRVAKPVTRMLHASIDRRSPPARFRIHKTGDAEPRFPVTGAQFAITRLGAPAIVSTFDVGPNGMSPWVILPAGRYVVSEVIAPPGYQRNQPFEVELVAGTERTTEVVDHIRRPTLQIRKVNEETGAPLAGAILRLWDDPDGDGIFQPRGLPITTTTGPLIITTLPPGTYRLTEVQAPSGFEPFAQRTFRLEPGAQVEIVLPDRPVPPVTLLPPTTTSRNRTPVTTVHPPSSTTPSTTTAPIPPSSSVPTTSIGPVPPISTQPPAPPSASPELPLTGTASVPLAELGLGLCLIGASLSRRSPRAQGSAATGK